MVYIWLACRTAALSIAKILEEAKSPFSFPSSKVVAPEKFESYPPPTHTHNIGSCDKTRVCCAGEVPSKCPSKGTVRHLPSGGLLASSPAQENLQITSYYAAVRQY